MKKIKLLFLMCSTLFAYNGSITGSSFFQYTNTSGNDEFSFSRSYILYKNSINKRSNIEVLMDAIFNEESGYTLILNNAFLSLDILKHNLTIGIIPLTTFMQHEKNWGYRYVEKSPIDYYAFSKEADIGIGISGKYGEKINYSIELTNGEGYNAIQSDNSEKLSGLVLYTYEKEQELPFNANFGSIFSYEIAINDGMNLLNGFFSSIKFLKSRFGIEYSTYKDNRGSYTDGLLVSFYGSYNYTRKLSFFHRQDYYNKNRKIINLEDITYFISGIEYKYNKNVYFAFNLKDENFPKHYNIKNKSTYCLNMKYNF